VAPPFGKFRLLITDYDGTLKPHLGPVAPENCRIMKKMGQLGLIRAVATGRSLGSFVRDWQPEMELDYLIYSSGMALCRWTAQGPGDHIFLKAFPQEEQKLALKAALTLKMGFFAFWAPPDSHCFYYYDPPHTPRSRGFSARLEQFKAVASPWPGDEAPEPLSQFLIMVKSRDIVDYKNTLTQIAPTLSITQSTSPYDDDCIWLEVFPPGVTKSSGSQALIELLNIGTHETAALGNDFNDLDLLNWAGRSFVVPQSPPALLDRFEVLTGSEPILKQVWSAIGTYDPEP
jgi:hydroxymethylpyrimidine pyrophosphatase-like HAD family hydrolase